MKHNYLTLLLLLPLIASAQWNQANGPFEATLSAIIEHQGITYAVGNGAGIFKSTDYGLNWEKIYSPVHKHNLPVHVADNGTIFTADSGIVRSTDDGISWQRMEGEINNFDISMIDSDSSGTLYASTFGGSGNDNNVFKSVDNGNTWLNVLNAGMDLSTLHVTDDGQVWYGTIDALWRSDDAGETWNQLQLPLPNLYNVNSIDSDTEGSVFVASEWNTALFRTDNDGATWTQLLFHNDVGQIRILDVEEDDELVVDDYGMLIRSADKGYSWDTIYTAEGVSWASAYEAVNQDTILAAYKAFLFSEDNGINWETRNNGLIAAGIPSVAVTVSGKVFAVSNNLWMSENQGASWINVNDPTGSFSFFSLKSNPSGLYLTSQDDLPGNEYKFSRSTDEGLNWQVLFRTSQPVNPEMNSMGDIFMIDSYVLRRSTDDGQTWESITIDGQILFTGQFTITSNDVLVVREMYTHNLLISFDNGDTWESLQYPYFFNWLTFMKSDYHGNVYIHVIGNAAEDHLSRIVIDANDHTWQIEEITPVNLTGIITNMFFDPDGPLFLQTDLRLYRSTDSALTWNDFQSESVEPYATFNELAFDTVNHIIYGAHTHTGVWLFEDYMTRYAGNLSPEGHSLSIYPNPANGTATINAQNTSQQQSIAMYNITGSLINTIKLTGTTTVLSLRGIRPGVYFLQGPSHKGVKLVVK